MARETALVLREGAPVRTVGSHHYWLEDGGPRGGVAKGLIYAASDEPASEPSEKAELALVVVGNKG